MDQEEYALTKEDCEDERAARNEDRGREISEGAPRAKIEVSTSEDLAMKESTKMAEGGASISSNEHPSNVATALDSTIRSSIDLCLGTLIASSPLSLGRTEFGVSESRAQCLAQGAR